MTKKNSSNLYVNLLANFDKLELDLKVFNLAIMFIQKEKKWQKFEKYLEKNLKEEG